MSGTHSATDRDNSESTQRADGISEAGGSARGDPATPDSRPGDVLPDTEQGGVKRSCENCIHYPECTDYQALLRVTQAGEWLTLFASVYVQQHVEKASAEFFADLCSGCPDYQEKDRD